MAHPLHFTISMIFAGHRDCVPSASALFLLMLFAFLLVGQVLALQPSVCVTEIPITGLYKVGSHDRFGYHVMVEKHGRGMLLSS